MLELPITELQQRINEELQENPVLEVGEDLEDLKPSAEENDYSQEDDCSDIFGEEQGDDPLYNEDFDYNQYVDDDELPDYRYQTNNYSPDDDYEQAPIVMEKDFHEHLIEQIGQHHLTEQQRQIAEYIVGNIDSRGYLTRSPMQMVDDLAFHAGIEISDAEMDSLVDMVRHLDPPGVGACDLRECLLLQLRRMPESPANKLAITLIDKCIEEVGKHHYDRLQRRFNVSPAELQAAMDRIRACNAVPSAAFSGDLYDSRRAQIIPDFRVETYNDEIIVTLCDQDIPSLHISQDYEQMLSDMQAKAGKKTADQKEGIRFIKQKMDSAKWFIDAIRQRNETLLSTMKAIVLFQRDYFLEGDDCFLKPMILEDVAKLTGYDASTISRVSNSKYVLTDFGIIPLKHFFSEALTTEAGDEVSTREVKKVLREVIDKEDKRHPLNDDKLVAILSLDGYKVARRTIAKYRDQLGIPVASRRKQINHKTE